jgi:hypothetical protein
MVCGLPGPNLVVYEAGPAGFGLARCPVASGIECGGALQNPELDIRNRLDAKIATMRNIFRLNGTKGS